MPYLNVPYGQTPYNMAPPLPPQAPFQPTTIHNTPYASHTPLRPSTYTPYAPPPPQLPSYSTPFAPPTQLPTNSTPYAPPPAPLPSYSTPYAPAHVQLPYAGSAPAPYGAPVQPPVKSHRHHIPISHIGWTSGGRFNSSLLQFQQ
ncbi:hypothetical protein MPER_01171 [Moniliophthora perniciosa FA553]|nr:hypothetical protein MPER_01171 [Moniliophthora perniciosa FA553]